MLDIFGVPLSAGQYIIYADSVGDTGPELAVLKVTEVTGNTITAEQVNAPFIGKHYYLVDPAKRIAVVGNDRDMYNANGYYRETVTS